MIKKIIESTVEGAKLIDLCVEGDKLLEQGTGAVYNKPVKGVKVTKGAGLIVIKIGRLTDCTARCAPFFLFPLNFLFYRNCFSDEYFG